MFTVVLGMLCNSNFDSTCGPPGVTRVVLAPPDFSFLNGHTIRPYSFLSFAVGFVHQQQNIPGRGPGYARDHYKHNSLVSSSVSNNQSRLTHIWIYKCWVRQVTYPDILVRWVIVTRGHLTIRCVILQYGLYTLELWWHMIKVYIWEFLCLDYSFEVLISWSHKSDLYDWFCFYSVLSILSVFYQFYDVFVV